MRASPWQYVLELLLCSHNVGFARYVSKKLLFYLSIRKNLPFWEGFFLPPAVADIFFIGIQNIDDGIWGQIAYAFPEEPLGAESRGADGQMGQRQIEAGCFVRDRRREEVVFVRFGDGGLGPVTGYRRPECLLVRPAAGHHDKIGNIGKF